MSSVPNEVLRDVLMPLDRWTLDAAQFTNRRFLQLIMERMSDVCLRPIYLASFRGPIEYGTTLGSLYIHVDQPERTLSKVHKDTAHLFREFVRALRSSRVASFTLNRLDFNAVLAALVLQEPIFTDALSLVEGSCVQMTPARFSEVVRHLSPTALDMSTSRLRGCQISDEFLRELSHNGVRRITVTDDAIVEFCVQQDVQISQEGDAEKPYGELIVGKGSFTKDLFKRLVEARSVSKRTQPLRIVVSPVRFEEEDLRDFAHNLSYRHRGQPKQLRIYTFPDEQQVGGMHTQIVLHPDKKLEMIRARRPHPFFHESDE